MDKSLRPMTLVLGAFCLWALCLLVLVLAGLGGRFALLGDNAGVAPPLKSVTLRALAPRLGGPETYAEVGQRPLLNFDRRPAPVAVSNGADGSGELDVMLTSVMITPSLKLAIVRKIEGGTVSRVRLGERVEGTGWVLVSLQPRRAVFEGQGGQRALDLRAYDGNGGEAPTAVATTQPMAPPPFVAQAGQQATPAPVAMSAPAQPNSQAVAAGSAAAMTQEQQVEAIRRRIEARRAQMRQENARAAAQPTK